MTHLYPTLPATEFPTAELCHITEIFNTTDHPGLSIAQSRVEPGITTVNHRLRDTDEWYYIQRGTGEMFLDSRSAGMVQAGDVVFIPANTPQYIRNAGLEDLVFLCVCKPGFREGIYEEVKEEISA